MREMRAIACYLQQHVWYAHQSTRMMCTVAAVMELQQCASTANVAAELYRSSCDGMFLQPYAVGLKFIDSLLGFRRIFRFSGNRQVVASIPPLFPKLPLSSRT